MTTSFGEKEDMGLERKWDIQDNLKCFGPKTNDRQRTA